MIILAATPIGNLGDASSRLRETLQTATVIAAEDTRKTISLMRLLEIDNRPELISLNDHNEHTKAATLVERAKNEDIVVVSDAGMPTVSDPGFKLVQLAARSGVRVTALPGPSAVVTALAVSGLPSDRFIFDGFVPRKASDRARLIADLQKQSRTVVLFESPNRIAATLEEFAAELGDDREAVVCRELTKMFEEVKRGPLGELKEWASHGVKGEIVLLIGPAPETEANVESYLDVLMQRVAEGERLKTVAKDIAEQTGIPTRDLYEATLEQQKKNKAEKE